MLKSLGRYSDYAPTVVRLVLGATLLFAHGIPKLMEGPEGWEGLGRAMGNVGITFAPTFWGFMAGFTETLVGLLFWLGLAVRPASVMIMFVMLIATFQQLAGGGGLSGGRAHPVDFVAAVLALLILGAGAFSLDRKLGLEKPASTPTSRSVRV